MIIDTAKQKERLESMLNEVTDELKSIGIHNPENPDDWIAVPEKMQGEADSNIVADRVESWDERAATLAELETRYNNIRRALQHIADGTYGICEIGGERIEPERLEANPAARTCENHMEAEHTLPR